VGSKDTSGMSHQFITSVSPGNDAIDVFQVASIEERNSEASGKQNNATN